MGTRHRNTGFTQVNWSVVPRALAASRGWPTDGSLIAVYPSPVNADACFEAAGFVDFADATDAWDDDFRALVRVVLEQLDTYGPRHLRQRPDTKPPMLDGDALALLIEPATGAYGEDFLTLYEFGTPAVAALQTAGGHEILWIWLATTNVGKLLDLLATRWVVRENVLRWEGLIEHYGALKRGDAS